MLMILSFMLLLNFILPFLNHSLSTTIVMVIQHLLICLLMSLSNSSWFSYILFLSFLGGMLVLFIYMTTLASNELMNFPIKSLIISTITTSLIIIFSTQ